MHFSQSSYPLIPGHQWKARQPGLVERLENYEEKPVLWYYSAPGIGANDRPISVGWHSRHTGDFESYDSLKEAVIDLLLKGDIHGPVDFDAPFVPEMEQARSMVLDMIAPMLTAGNHPPEVAKFLRKIKEGVAGMNLL